MADQELREKTLRRLNEKNRIISINKNTLHTARMHIGNALRSLGKGRIAILVGHSTSRPPGLFFARSPVQGKTFWVAFAF